MSLHEELVGGSTPACKLCAFLAGLNELTLAAWERELSLPITVVRNTAVVRALKNRGVEIEEASVRRHRRNHSARP